MIIPPLPPQALELDVYASVDDDDGVDVDFDFHWYCEDNAGGACISRVRETLELSSSAGETTLFLPAGSLPAGKFRNFETEDRK